MLGEFVVLDLETTGLSSATDEIIEIGAVSVVQNLQIESEFAVIVRPTREVPADITGLTGITQELLVADGVPIGEALGRLWQFIGDRPIYAHHAAFDEAFLQRAAAQCGAALDRPFHDTIAFAKVAFPGLGSYSLANLARHIGVALPPHRALDDARTTLAVLAACVKEIAG